MPVFIVSKMMKVIYGSIAEILTKK